MAEIAHSKITIEFDSETKDLLQLIAENLKPAESVDKRTISLETQLGTFGMIGTMLEDILNDEQANTAQKFINLRGLVNLILIRIAKINKELSKNENENEI